VAHTADAVVVGAGVIGCSVALELRRAGLDVLVIERLPGPGLGSTSASSAIVRFNYSTRAGVAAAWEAKHCWGRWRDHLEAAPERSIAGFRRTGLALLDVDVIPRERILRHFDDVGVPYEEWDATTLAARIPGIDVGRHWPPKALADDAFWSEPAGQLGAVWTPDAGFVDDPQLAAADLADAAQRRGVRFLFRREVVAVRRDRGRVRGLDLADGDAVDAPVVVNVAGPWSARLNVLAGVGSDFTIGVRPMRQEVHAVPAPPGYSDGVRLGPVIADVDLGTYLRATPGGDLLVGGTEPECDPLQWLDDPDEAQPNPTRPVFDAQVTRAARRFPHLQVPSTVRGVVGVYDVADDWTPIYDRTDLPGYYVAIGTSGNQFKNAPVVGRFLAAIITAVENGHDHDASPVRHVGEHTGLDIDLGAFSRRRAVTGASSVLG
jgi:glycine/D-amino acid oxidase-like deaminating enzyme